MSDWLDQLLVGLREARVDLSAEDVADAVWLAPYLDPPRLEPEAESRAQADEPVIESKPPPVATEQAAPEPPVPTPAPVAEGPRPSGKRQGELHLPGDPSGPGTGGGRPLRAPTGSALPGTLALARALRPLRRRVASRTRRVLDVAETVRRVAEEGTWLPALRPARDRWLEFSMVFDAGGSMGPWRSMATELLALFSSLGAFRSVRVWSLETDSDPIRLRAGISRAGSSRRDPRELVDPAGRTLIVVLTDGVADSWSDGRAARLVEDWSRAGPVGLFQVLPEHLWNRSALGLASAVRLTAAGPASANSRLSARATDPWADPLGREGSPLPVASLTPQGLSAWAGVVAGAVGAEVPGYRLDLAPDPMPVGSHSAPPPTPRERLQRFSSAASPPARRLAGLLAASPAITLPVIRLIRQALLPEGRQVHEAEVLLGDLLRIVDAPGKLEVDPDEVRYDFREGLRSLLLDAVPAADALQVLGGVSSYVEKNLTHGLDFRAMLADPTAAGRGAIVLDESPFARVAAEVLLRLGGDYARLVTALPETRSTGPVAGPATAGSPPGRIGQAPPLEDPPPLPGARPHSRRSSQQKLNRARKPRVQMTYDVDFAGFAQKRELPFVIGVLADLSGRPKHHMGRFSDRKFIEIDRDKFDEVMMAIAPGLTIPLKNYPGVKEVFLAFGSMSDFEPQVFVEQSGPLADLLIQVRYMSGRNRSIDSGLEFGYVDTSMIQKRLASCIRDILHHPDFQRLEATWRGLHYLVRNAETGRSLKIKVLDVSRRELAWDQEKEVEFDQFALFAKIQEPFNMPGGEPFGLLVGDYEFERSPQDLWLLAGISDVAAAAEVPFVSSAGPTMFNLASFDALPSFRTVPEAQEFTEFLKKWNAFRDSENSRYVALVLPRVLGRHPYGANSRPIEAFPFEELTEAATKKQYLWMSAGWALAVRVADAIANHGWPAAIRGIEGGGLVGDLPLYRHPDERGAIEARCTTRSLINDRREAELSRDGFIPLAHLRSTDEAAFFSVPTCHRPRLYDQPEFTAAARQAAQLNVVLCVSRVVHYLKIIGSSRKNSSPSADGMKALLKTWIQGYISDDPQATADFRSRYPLADARVEVEDSPRKPGSFRVTLHISLAFQFEQSPVSLRAVFDLPERAD